MHTSGEIALRAILHAEEAKKIYKNIKETFGKQQIPLTQVDVLSNPNNRTSEHITLTSKEEIELNILKRNRRHSLQSLSTPFLSHPQLRQAIDPLSEENFIDQLLLNEFKNEGNIQDSFTDTEKQWIETLQKGISTEISLPHYHVMILRISFV